MTGLLKKESIIIRTVCMKVETVEKLSEAKAGRVIIKECIKTVVVSLSVMLNQNIWEIDPQP